MFPTRHLIAKIPLRSPKLFHHHANLYSSSTIQHDPQPFITIKSRSLSTQKPSPENLSKPSPTNTKPARPAQPSLGGSNSHLKELWRNASRPAKIVILIAFTIASTVETIFWCKVIWAKIQAWRGVNAEEGEQ